MTTLDRLCDLYITAAELAGMLAAIAAVALVVRGW